MNYPKVFFICSLFLSVFSTSVFACRCAKLNAVDVLNYEQNKFVFLGTVASAKLNDLNSFSKVVEAEVLVQEQFKGLIKDELFKVTAELETSACGGPISVGSQYVLVVDSEGSIDFCTSRLINPYDSELYVKIYIDQLRSFSK